MKTRTIKRIWALFLITLAFTACTNNDIRPAKALLAYTSARPDSLVEPSQAVEGFEQPTGQPAKPTNAKPAKGKHQPASAEGVAPDRLSRPADATAL
ncbi:hypothetical protein BN8_05768 [Fibrisoma limi BUZ 3]|uniref:Lipoprotein n=1 Tax=Fibrisoma limi BUZ 3 TaxID=1185876 RepID=I2GRA4_9BACT|nr:hypothetical protein [Fibrisoma limi]CCH56432.1 hypothetical protein BN8_05768 [Fibrisoma limi BUZ 3]